VGTSYGSIIPGVIDDLVLYVDAAKRASYSGTGTSWFDISPNGRTGTLTNGPVHTGFGKIGSFDFDGTDDFVNFGNIFNFINTDSFSTEAWINWDGGAMPSNFGHIIGKTFGNYRTSFQIVGGSGRVSFRLDSNFMLVDTGLILSPNNWYHIVSTWNPSTKTGKVYVNGTQQATNTNAGTDWTETGANFQIGNSPGENYQFNGKISIGRVYSKTLSAEEVLKNYNATKGRFGL
jgi:hypothetical protein